MTLKAQWLAFACVICLVGGWSARGHYDLVAQQAVPAAQGRAPVAPAPFIVTNIYTSADGLAHFGNKEIKSGELQKVAGVIFGRRSGKLAEFNDAHAAPNRRFILPLSGRVEMQDAGGVTKSFGPGDVVLLEDVTGTGHKTRTVGGQDAIWMFIEVDQPRPTNPAQH